MPVIIECKLDVITLRAKRVWEIIEIRHKKISPTRILGTLGSLSLCNSVANLKPVQTCTICRGAWNIELREAEIT